MSLTVEQVVVQALARAHEVTDNVPGTRSLAYRYIGIRQQALFAAANAINPDFYGVCATAVLDNGVADLKDFPATVPTPEIVTLVRVANPGTSTLPQGTDISIVPSNDIASAIPPRVTLRNLVLEQVGLELAGVTSVKVFYSARPKGYAPDDGDLHVQLPSPWDELLVIGLTKYLLAKCTQIPDDRRGFIVGRLDAEEQALMAGYHDHVSDFAPLEARFT